MRPWLSLAIGWLLVFAGGGLASVIQTSGGVTIEDVRFDGGDGKQLSALLYRPSTATPEKRAPGILAVHGYINSRETQSGFAIEFARRGYVVLALDQSGHGFSDPPAFANAFGGPAGLTYLRALPYVDTDNIGLEGHSMGGWTVLNAAAIIPDGYRAIVLEGSSTGPGFAPPATPQSPRNLGVVFSKFDEFSTLMWGVDKAANVTSSEKLKGVFGTTDTIEPGRVYGSIEAGTGRWLATPTTTHPGDHISGEAIGDAIRWFDMTLKGAKAISPDDQIWFWKEIGTLIALVGGFVVLLGAFNGFATLPWLSAAKAAPSGIAESKSPVWWISLFVTAAIPALSFFPITEWGAKLMPGSTLFPQNITNQILVWALFNGAIGLVICAIRWRTGNEGKLPQKVILALASVAMVYLAVWLSDALFKTDFRFWVVALKPMAEHHITAFLAYLVPFTAFFYASQRAQAASLTLRESSRTTQYLVGIIATAGGMFILMAALYIWLFANGQLPGVDPLFTIVGIQFVPVLIATSTIATFTWRRTNGALTGALICGLLVTWYIVAGQATHIA